MLVRFEPRRVAEGICICQVRDDNGATAGTAEVLGEGRVDRWLLSNAAATGTRKEAGQPSHVATELSWKLRGKRGPPVPFALQSRLSLQDVVVAGTSAAAMQFGHACPSANASASDIRQIW